MVRRDKDAVIDENNFLMTPKLSFSKHHFVREKLESHKIVYLRSFAVTDESIYPSLVLGAI